MRRRLTLWYTALVAIALVAFAVLSYGLLARALGRSTDESLEGAVAALSAAVTSESHEPDTVGFSPNAIVTEAAREFRISDVTLFVLDDSNTLVATVDNGVPRDVLGDANVRGLLSRAREKSPAFATPAGNSQLRLVAVRSTVLASNYVIVAGRSTAEDSQTLATVRDSYYVTVPLVVILAALGGALLARRSLRPVAAMGDRAEKIRATTLHERLPVPNADDELGGLAKTFNDLLARLESSFEQQRRFMADASHELRTPVAVVRGESEVALSQPDRPPSEYRESLEIVHDEGKRLTRIVDELFLLARADAGQVPLQLSSFTLDELAADSVHSVRSLATGRDVTVELSTNGVMPIRGDEAMLGRMLRNLLDNAIKHAPAGSTVWLRLSSNADEYVLEVEDRGAGIPEAAQPHVFERFYRVDSARSRGNGSTGNGSSGAGLGLAIARWVAEAHGGRLVLQRSSGDGTVFEVRLPVSSET